MGFKGIKSENEGDIIGGEDKLNQGNLHVSTDPILCNLISCNEKFRKRKGGKDQRFHSGKCRGMYFQMGRKIGEVVLDELNKMRIRGIEFVGLSGNEDPKGESKKMEKKRCKKIFEYRVLKLETVLSMTKKPQDIITDKEIDVWKEVVGGGYRWMRTDGEWAIFEREIFNKEEVI